MSEQQGTIRVNISVPRELKAQMEATTPAVNWSAVASDAFRVKLKELDSQQKVKNMDDVIARMKAADEIDGNEEYQAGCQAGERWAKEEARPKELRRLEKWRDECATATGYESPENDAFRMEYHVHEAIFTETTRQDSAEFWEFNLGDEYPDAKALQGFVEGALDIWEKVKEQI